MTANQPPWVFSLGQSANNLRAIDSGSSRSIVSYPNREWRSASVEKLNELCALERGWDGYRAGPVSFETATFALSLLDVTCPANGIAPQIVPGVGGDLQIEWHTSLGDIEIHVRRPYDVLAWHRSPAVPAGVTTAMVNDFTAVTKWLKDIAEPVLAVATAA